MSVPMVTVLINNKKYQVRANVSVLQACEQALIEVPRFCYHEKLSVSGNCRMCLVEVFKSPKPVVSCAMPVSKGMIIQTETPLVKKAREAVLEFLLLNHPLDCPICDQGGECDLQDETLVFGSDRGRNYEFKRSVEDKACGPIVKTIMTRCIHCTRCVRFSSEIAGNEVLGSFGRGQETEIGTYIQSFLKTELAGNLVDLCPVGALTSKPYAYSTRNWELQKINTVDFFDGICTDIVVQTRKSTTVSYKGKNVSTGTKEEILRVLPRLNLSSYDNWITDRTRYAFDALRNQRMKSISLNVANKVASTVAAADKFYFLFNRLNVITYSVKFEKNDLRKNDTRKLGLILGSLTDISEAFVMSNLIKFLGFGDVQYENYKMALNVDAPFFYSLNTSINSFEKTNCLFVVGSNLRYEASILNTMIRKYQMRRNFQLINVGAYSDLRLKQNHFGNGLRALINIIQNRSVLSLNLINMKNVSLILGAESLKNKNGFFLQNLLRLLGKKLFLTNKKTTRFGILHSSVGSLSTAFLGIQPNVRSALNVSEEKDKGLRVLMLSKVKEFKNTKWISAKANTSTAFFGTHKLENYTPEVSFPVTSFYEKDSLFINIENRIRKGRKALVQSPSAIGNVETFGYGILHYNQDFIHGEDNTYKVIENFIKPFNKMIPMKNLLEKVPSNFSFNFFSIFEEESSSVLYSFKPTVYNFYMNDNLSKNSPVMGECVLFLGKESNFIYN